MTNGPSHVPRAPAGRSRSAEAAVLLWYAATGAFLAFALLAILAQLNVVKWPGAEPASSPPASASPSPSASARCPLHASPRPCDECMAAHCDRECLACAADADCLDLFLCATECADSVCESSCAVQYPAGKRILQAFVGQSGCLAIFCRSACGSLAREEPTPAAPR